MICNRLTKTITVNGYGPTTQERRPNGSGAIPDEEVRSGLVAEAG
jgi:hypothetical protein